jgi:hypothetical protein
LTTRVVCQDRRREIERRRSRRLAGERNLEQNTTAIDRLMRRHLRNRVIYLAASKIALRHKIWRRKTTGINLLHLDQSGIKSEMNFGAGEITHVFDPHIHDCRCIDGDGAAGRIQSDDCSALGVDWRTS